jgi:hypothetical protein
MIVILYKVVRLGQYTEDIFVRNDSQPMRNHELIKKKKKRISVLNRFFKTICITIVF